jgi:predicted SnoaL-like aldol condensation-catalyzing enzyme
MVPSQNKELAYYKILVLPRSYSDIRFKASLPQTFPITSQTHSVFTTTKMRFSIISPLLLASSAMAAKYCPSKPATDAEQLKIWNEFAAQLYDKKDVGGAFSDFVSPNLIEHSPNSTSLQGTIGFLSFLFPQVKITMINNGFFNHTGFLHMKAEGETLGRPNALVDIYRMEGTCMVEHWDIMQAAAANMPNPIGMF